MKNKTINRRYKVVLVSVGTRGDMEPFLAVGELLKAKGHDVIAAFPEQFRGLAEDTDVAFFSLGAKYSSYCRPICLE